MIRTAAVPTFVPTAIRGLFVALLVLIPFHALLTVYGASLVGHYTLLRLWPEIVMLVLISWFVAAAARDTNFRTWLKREPLCWLIIAYGLWLILMTVKGLVAEQATSLAAAQGLITDIRLPAALVVGFVLTYYRPSFLRYCPKYLLLPAALVVVFGLLQAFVLPPDFLSHLGYNSHTIAAVETVDQKTGYQRLQSTLRGANPLGAYLVVTLPLTLVALVRFKKYRPWLAALLLASLVLLTYTYSRSAYLGATVALLAAAFWLARRRRLVLGIALILILIAAAGLLAFRHNDRFQNTFFHTDNHSLARQSSNQVRATDLRNGLNDIWREPLGRGVGTAGPASAHNAGRTRIAENYYLQIGQETGWAGLALFLALNGLVLFRLWRLKDQPVALALAASFLGLVVVNMLSHAWADDTLSVIWWGAAGVALGASAILTAESKQQNDQKISQAT